MLLEIAAFYGLFCLILFAFAEQYHHREIGLIASLFLLILGLWILTSGIQIATGTATTIITGAMCEGLPT